MKELINQITYYFDSEVMCKTEKIIPSISSLSSLLPYRSFDETTSFFYQEKSVGFLLEINPLCGAMDETYALLSHFISNLENDAVIECFLWANPSLKQHEDVYVKSRCNDITKLISQKRFDYFSSSTWNAKDGIVIRNFELFISLSFPLTKNTRDITLMREQLKNTLLTIGIHSQDVNATRFIHFIQSQVSGEKERVSWCQQTPLNEQVFSWDMEVNVHANSLSLYPNKTIQVFSVQHYPKQWAGIAMGECLGSLLKETMMMPSPFLLHWVVKPKDKSQAKKRAMVKSLRNEQLAVSSLGKLIPRAKKVAADWQAALHAFDEGESLVELLFQVVLISHSEEATKAASHFQSLWQSLGFEVIRERYLQLPLWLCSLPFMVAEHYYSDLKQLKRFKTVLSANAAHLMPIQAEYRGGQTPCLPLVGRRGQLFFFDSFDNQEGNFNVAVAGKSGSGKSVLMQELMTGLLGLGGKVFVLDVGRSFEKACLLHGGEFIALEMDAPISLNPFTFIQSLNESMSMLKPLIGAMAHHQRQTDDYENALIEKAIVSVWESEGQNATITSIAHFLLNQTDARACDLGTQLFPYTKDGMYGHFFEGPCGFDFTNPLIVLELEELKSKKDLQQIVLMLLMVHVTEAMYRGNRETKVTCIIDEAWDLLRGDLAGELMETGCRRARKYKGAFITGTQSINDFYQNKASQAAIENSDHLLLLSQSEEAIEQLDKEKRLFMNESMKLLLKSLKTKKGKYSEVLLKTPQGFCVARLCLDPFSRALYSSSAEVVAHLNRLRQQGIPLMEAIQQLEGLES